ncbi:hypothetical protein MTR_4g121540 [Medicago truncatula]|uniref:Uncharacterized protein n=1 Tax=Medicago truncatula TaxID=3880 RepID=G7JMR4_MEDTR|nr:hypothetical protein MTR_4g121540 [Medicago truncatula]
MALVLTLPIGSQISWIQCHNKKAPQKKQPPTTSSSDPSLSSSFFVLHKKTETKYMSGTYVPEVKQLH